MNTHGQAEPLRCDFLLEVLWVVSCVCQASPGSVPNNSLQSAWHWEKQKQEECGKQTVMMGDQRCDAFTATSWYGAVDQVMENVAYMKLNEMILKSHRLMLYKQ